MRGLGSRLDPPRAGERRRSEQSQRPDHLPWMGLLDSWHTACGTHPPTFLRQPRRAGDDTSHSTIWDSKIIKFTKLTYHFRTGVGLGRNCRGAGTGEVVTLGGPETGGEVAVSVGFRPSRIFGSGFDPSGLSRPCHPAVGWLTSSLAVLCANRAGPPRLGVVEWEERSGKGPVLSSRPLPGHSASSLIRPVGSSP
jgi:hypothetical protein